MVGLWTRLWHRAGELLGECRPPRPSGSWRSPRSSADASAGEQDCRQARVPGTDRPPGPKQALGPARGRGTGEGLAAREAVALTKANGHLERSAVIRVEARRTLEGPSIRDPEVQPRGSWWRMEPLRSTGGGTAIADEEGLGQCGRKRREVAIPGEVEGRRGWSGGHGIGQKDADEVPAAVGGRDARYRAHGRDRQRVGGERRRLGRGGARPRCLTVGSLRQRDYLRGSTDATMEVHVVVLVSCEEVHLSAGSDEDAGHRRWEGHAGRCPPGSTTRWSRRIGDASAEDVRGSRDLDRRGRIIASRRLDHRGRGSRPRPRPGGRARRACSGHRARRPQDGKEQVDRWSSEASPHARPHAMVILLPAQARGRVDPLAVSVVTFERQPNRFACTTFGDVSSRLRCVPTISSGDSASA